MRCGTEGALRIDPEISPPVLILGYSESEYIERSTDLQEKEEHDKQQSTRIFLTSEVVRWLKASNAVASYYGGG